MAAAILSGRVDYVRATDPATVRKAKATPGMSTATYYQSVIHATWVNNHRKPLDDPRVRRAMHLVLDQPVLVEVVKDVAPLIVGASSTRFRSLRRRRKSSPSGSATSLIPLPRSTRPEH